MKRLFDLIFSTILIVLFSPLLLVLAILIIVFQGKPILFKQNRLGENHRPMKIIKFCTMSNEVNAEGKLLPDIDRTTKIGSFLRNSSLDELPGLWNVLKGEMSVVGPRPLPPQYKERYTPEQDRRHNVKPGITGWAQINGRNAISWEEKFLLDEWYVDNQSFLLDLKIIFLTIHRVLLRKDIIPIDKDAMEEFFGTK